MQFKKFTHDFVVELLTHLAKNQRFDSIKGLENVSQKDISELMHELSAQVKNDSEKHPIERRSLRDKFQFSDDLMHVIDKLSPQEENVLLKSFKIDD